MRGNKKASSLAAINLPAFIVVRAVRIYICSEVWKGKVKGYQVTWKPLV
jgi:hypothetical protein